MLLSAPDMIRSHTGTPPTGTRSLAALLAKDGSGFDKNWSDYDILDNAVGAVGAVLAAKPKSPVAVLALKVPRSRSRSGAGSSFSRTMTPNARNPIVVQPNLNKGNKQIGHGINRC
ncbi:MAG: hypothetical protein WAN44_02790 [Propionibacteriaceae bacterium]